MTPPVNVEIIAGALLRSMEKGLTDEQREGANSYGPSDEGNGCVAFAISTPMGRFRVEVSEVIA
jgi:hypothetical protein